MSDNPIRPEDLRIEVVRPHPPGGQHVGVYCGVKITHIPTGLVAICDAARSQFRNKKIAMDMLLGGLTSPEFRP
jgi:peptide chain release factor 2